MKKKNVKPFKKLSKAITFAFGLFLVLTLLVQCSNDKADLIITNGKVVTVDKEFSIREAVAVKEDRILSVGSLEEMKKLKGKTTQIMYTIVGGKVRYKRD